MATDRYDVLTPAYEGVGRRLRIPIVQVGEQFVAGCLEGDCGSRSDRCPSWDAADTWRMLHALGSHRAPTPEKI